jgi:CRISPR-associated protein Cas2
MAVTQPRKWLIAYDIREPRRLKRVHALLSKTAVPVQYSLFAAAGSALAMRQLASAVGQRIDARADDVRFYPVPDRPFVYTIGHAMLPDEALLLDARTDLGAVLGRGASAATR